MADQSAAEAKQQAIDAMGEAFARSACNPANLLGDILLSWVYLTGQMKGRIF
jgi:hypothetical protein